MDQKGNSPRSLPKIKTATEDHTTVSPPRSRTDPPAPEKHHHEKSHLHRRLHSSSLRNRAFTSSREHGYRHAAKETVQSAIELKPPISFDTLLRRDKKNPEDSRRSTERRHHHRHHHHQQQQQSRDHHDTQREASEGAEQQTQQTQPRRVTVEDVAHAKRQNAKREKELQDSLKNVEEVAMRSTRQLDDTYYMILEKASLLRSTVSSLQQLAEESRRLHRTFQEETGELEQETKKNLEALGNFDGQEETIHHLVARLSKSKDRTKKLNERLEAARDRVEAFETRERERRKARRIQYSAIWAVVIGILILIVGIMVAKKRSAGGTRLHKVAKVLDEFGHEVIEIASPVVAVLKPTESLSEDTYLKELFDDL